MLLLHPSYYTVSNKGKRRNTCIVVCGVRTCNTLVILRVVSSIAVVVERGLYMIKWPISSELPRLLWQRWSFSPNSLWTIAKRKSSSSTHFIDDWGVIINVEHFCGKKESIE